MSATEGDSEPGEIRTVTVDNVDYTLGLSYDRDGIIEYFHLLDQHGEIFFEADYATDSLSDDEIRELVESRREHSKPTLQARADSPAVSVVGNVAETADIADSKGAREARDAVERESSSKMSEEQCFLAMRPELERKLDATYPFYADLGPEFRESALLTLYHFRDESDRFLDVVLDESAEYWKMSDL